MTIDSGRGLCGMVGLAITLKYSVTLNAKFYPSQLLYVSVVALLHSFN